MNRLPYFILIGYSLLTATVNGQPNTAYLNFKARHLLVLSDADMLASAYVTGDAGPKPGGLHDALTILPMVNQGVTEQRVVLPVSNSVKAWPNNLAVTPDGRFAFVTELYGPAPAGQTAIGATPDGHLVTMIALTPKPFIRQQIRLGARIGAIDVRPQGDLIAVTSGETGKELALIPLRNGQLKQPRYIRLSNTNAANSKLSHIVWHPSGDYFAVTLSDEQQVCFFRYQSNGQIEPWGTAVSPGKLPGVGYFTPDGNHYVVTNLFWGEDVAGSYGGSQQGMLTVIRFAAQAEPEGQPRHTIVSTAATGGSPENFAISPDGRWVVSLDMEQSYFPPNSPFYTPYSALTLYQFSPTTGRLRIADRARFDGILPEGITFDAASNYLAVAVFDHHNPQRAGGTVDFWQLFKGDEPKLLKLDYTLPVMRGAHIIKRID
ncbi:lactonase family protein [Spirosoma arcticum]